MAAGPSHHLPGCLSRFGIPRELWTAWTRLRLDHPAHSRKNRTRSGQFIRYINRTSSAALNTIGGFRRSSPHRPHTLLKESIERVEFSTDSGTAAGLAHLRSSKMSLRVLAASKVGYTHDCSWTHHRHCRLRLFDRFLYRPAAAASFYRRGACARGCHHHRCPELRCTSGVGAELCRIGPIRYHAGRADDLPRAELFHVTRFGIAETRSVSERSRSRANVWTIPIAPEECLSAPSVSPWSAAGRAPHRAARS